LSGQSGRGSISDHISRKWSVTCQQISYSDQRCGCWCSGRGIFPKSKSIMNQGYIFEVKTEYQLP
jgi:hypothetical protein